MTSKKKYLTIKNILACIHSGYRNKLSKINVRVPKKLMQILWILQYTGLIYTYTECSEYTTIYLKYLHSLPAWQSTVFYHKNSHKYYISYKNLKKLIWKPSVTTTIYILQTKLGILSGTTAINKKIGGTLLIKIN